MARTVKTSKSTVLGHPGSPQGNSNQAKVKSAWLQIPQMSMLRIDYPSRSLW